MDRPHVIDQKPHSMCVNHGADSFLSFPGKQSPFPDQAPTFLVTESRTQNQEMILVHNNVDRKREEGKPIRRCDCKVTAHWRPGEGGGSH